MQGRSLCLQNGKTHPEKLEIKYPLFSSFKKTAQVLVSLEKYFNIFPNVLIEQNSYPRNVRQKKMYLNKKTSLLFFFIFWD